MIHPSVVYITWVFAVWYFIQAA